jgi:hypothetical protein
MPVAYPRSGESTQVHYGVCVDAMRAALARRRATGDGVADETEAWSRPDGGVDPEDYVDGPQDREPEADADGDDPPHDRETAIAGDDEMAPGRSIVDETDDDVVEPNEPA